MTALAVFSLAHASKLNCPNGNAQAPNDARACVCVRATFCTHIVAVAIAHGQKLQQTLTGAEWMRHQLGAYGRWMPSASEKVEKSSIHRLIVSNNLSHECPSKIVLTSVWTRVSPWANFHSNISTHSLTVREWATAGGQGTNPIALGPCPISAHQI